MRKTSKGFTLIELLAVIVILAIIALIATPMILGVIDSAKKGAAESSIYGYIDAIEKSTLQDMIDTGNYKTKANGTYDLSAFTNVNYKGTEPSAVCVVIKDGTVESGAFKFNNYIVDYEDGKAKVNKDKTEISCNPTTTPEVAVLPAGLTKGTAVYVNPETKSVCNETDAVSTTGTKTGCMKWYVYKDNGNGTYQLILDHNTTATVAWNSSGSNADGMAEVAATLESDKTGWNSSLNARLITADEIAEITGNTSFSGATSDKWFYFDSNSQTQTVTSQGASNYAWLFDYTTLCTNYGCNIADNSNYGYWTSTLVSDRAEFAWHVGRAGFLYRSNFNYDGSYGVRPVITV